MTGWAALHAAGPDAVEAFIVSTDVEGECSGCGRLPREGCACTRETPDLIGVLDRRRARRSLRRVAAATNAEAARQAA